MRYSLSLIVALSGAAANAQVANFDGQAEGPVGTEYTENGITFRDLDPRIPGSTPPATLVIEDASADLSGLPAFTSPNTLGFSGYSMGPGVAFSRFGSMRIIPPAPASRAAIDIFDFTFDGGNTINLAAYMGGNEVARASLPLPGAFSIRHTHLEVSAPQFDELRLFAEGPSNEGTIFAVIDNVTIESKAACYANCDGSTAPPVLNVNDFVCFQAAFAAGSSYANCDLSTSEPVLNVNDFVCFQTAFAAGCSAP